jgi:TPR repeat protein
LPRWLGHGNSSRIPDHAVIALGGFSALLAVIGALTTPAPVAVAPVPVEIPQWIRDQESAEPGEIARALIESIRRGEKSLSTDQIHTRATELKAAERATDAYLLYFYAARQGHGPSALALGSLNDPSYFTNGNELLDSPDPVQAHKWYSVAAATQVEGAQQRLQELRKHTEAAAMAGDTSAQRLLLNWK